MTAFSDWLKRKDSDERKLIMADVDRLIAEALLLKDQVRLLRLTVEEMWAENHDLKETLRRSGVKHHKHHHHGYD